jgi:hypothetical protein
VSLPPIPVTSPATSSSLIESRILGDVSPFIGILTNDLSTQINESFIYVGSSSCTGFEIWRIPFSRCREGLRAWYRAILFKVRFVAYEHHWNIVVFFDSFDLLP